MTAFTFPIKWSNITHWICQSKSQQLTHAILGNAFSPPLPLNRDLADAWLLHMQLNHQSETNIRSTKHKESKWKQHQTRNICSMVNLKQLLTSLALEKLQKKRKMQKKYNYMLIFSGYWAETFPYSFWFSAVICKAYEVQLKSFVLGNDLYNKGPDCHLQSHLTSTYLS